MAKNLKQILTIGSSEGEVLKIAGGNYRIIVSGEETDGAFAVIEMNVPPGAGPNPHSHAAINESFFVIEGELTFKTEAGKYIGKKHALVNIPPGGMVHGFKNLTDKPAKVLCTVMPAGLEDFFREMEEVMAEPATSEVGLKEKVREIAEKYGQKLYPADYFDEMK